MRNPVSSLAILAMLASGCSQEAGETPSPESAPTEMEAVDDDIADAQIDLPAAAADWLKAEYPDTENLLARHGFADIDGDGTQEIFAYVGGLGVCGTGGCPLIVLRQSGDRLEKVLGTSVTQLPLGILDTSSNGMHDIWVTTYGGGASQTLRRLPFDGASYPTNPTVDSVEVIESPGTTVISDGELTAI